MVAEAVPYKVRRTIPRKSVQESFSISLRKPTGTIERPIRTRPKKIRFAKPTLFSKVPTKGETRTTAMEYMEKTRPTHAPGIDFSAKTVGRKSEASAYTLFVLTMIV